MEQDIHEGPDKNAITQVLPTATGFTDATCSSAKAAAAHFLKPAYDVCRWPFTSCRTAVSLSYTLMSTYPLPHQTFILCNLET